MPIFIVNGDVMSKRFLSRDLISAEAFKMIDECGMNAFSVRQLAAKLGVRVSSLYNHIDNENDLFLEAAKRAADMYSAYIEDTVRDLPLEEATYRAGDAFRTFLSEHKYLYELLINPRWIGNPEFEKVNERFTQPIYYLLRQYGIEDQTAIGHIYVAMRVVTHGFASLETLGMFDGLSIDPTESYHMMIKSVIKMMKTIGNNKG